MPAALRCATLGSRLSRKERLGCLQIRLERSRARWAAAAAFDAEHDRVVVLNGTYDPRGEPTDIVLWDDWEMHSADPVPEPLALASVERHPQSVSLAWHARSSSGFTGAVCSPHSGYAMADDGARHAGRRWDC